MSGIGYAIEHPGAVLWEEYLQPMGISQSRFAREIDISFTRVNELINGKRGFTPDTALRVAKFFGTSPEFWMNWQATYDLQRTSKAHAKEYRKIKTVTAA